MITDEEAMTHARSLLAKTRELNAAILAARRGGLRVDVDIKNMEVQHIEEMWPRDLSVVSVRVFKTLEEEKKS